MLCWALVVSTVAKVTCHNIGSYVAKNRSQYTMVNAVNFDGENFDKLGAKKILTSKILMN